jgi:predicted PolB exonuclease-like 3'-5' exonuclease
MNIRPSASRRNVVLDIETVTTDRSCPKGALSAPTGQVVCICMLVDDGANMIERSFVSTNEESLLRQFWDHVNPNDLFIGHNILEFDLSFVRQRSWIVGLKPSRDIDLRRYYSHDLVDIMHLWSNWGSTPRPSLDGLADVLGLRRKTAKGTKVAERWASNDLESIANYCREDVRITFEAFLRLTFQPVPDRYRTSKLTTEEQRNLEVTVHSRD